MNSNFPTLTELNYVFAAVEIDGELMMVDASSKYYEPGKLPLRAMNITGLLIKEGSSSITRINNNNLNYRRVAAKYTLDVEGEKVLGNGKVTMKDYARVQAKIEVEEGEEDEDDQELIAKDNIEDDEDEDDEDDEDEDEENIYTYTNSTGMDEKYGILKSSFSSELHKPLQIIDDEIYLDAFVSLEFEKNPFLNENREYPAFFNSKHRIQHVSIIEIPDGYDLKSIPPDVKMKMINDKGEFSYTISKAPTSITVNCSFKINDDTFLPDEYASLYAFFNSVMDKQREKIVFVSKE